MAMTFEEFDQPDPSRGGAKAPGAVTFDEFTPQAAESSGNLWAGILGGDAAMGVLKGAAGIGTTLLRPVDAALNATGLTDMTNVQRKQALDGFFNEYGNPDSLAFKGGQLGAEIAGTAGIGGLLAKGVGAIAPTLTRLPAALESFGGTVGEGGSALSNAAIRTGAGAATGAAGAAMIDPESAGVGAVIGGVLPGVGQLASQGAKAAGWLTDMVLGRSGRVKAGQIFRDAAGANRGALEAANQFQGPQLTTAEMTAGQAAAGVDQDTWQALMKLAEKHDQSSFYRTLGDRQEAARMGALDRVTPDLAQAEAARTAADAVNYPAAEAVKFHADPALIKLADNPYFKKAQASIAPLIEAQGLTFKSNPTGYLNGVKLGLDKILSATGDTALSGAEKRAVYQLKESLMKWVEGKNPLYSTARKEHAQLSAPVNQSQILGEMQNVLAREGGGERATPFLNAMGRGENALLKRADQSPRFGGVEDVLTPQQLAVRDKVAQELARDRNLAEQAIAGEGGLRDIIAKDSGLPKLPGFLSVTASAANKGITAIESQIGRKTMAAIVEGAKSGKSANELLATVPAAQRSAVAMWLAKGGLARSVSPVAAAASAD